MIASAQEDFLKQQNVASNKYLEGPFSNENRAGLPAMQKTLDQDFAYFDG